MQKETDDQIAVRIIRETKERFNQLSEGSITGLLMI
jgi:predicted DNA-binding protein